MTGGEICNEFAQRDPRIRVIHQENQGLSAARNTGLAHANGNYIAFVDSDDIVDRAYIATLYELITEYKTDIAVVSHHYYSERERKYLFPYSESKNTKQVYDIRQWLDIDRRAMYQHAIFTAAWGKLFKKELFRDISFPLGKLSEDEFVSYKIYLRADSIAFYDCQLYTYRLRGDSITNSERFAKILCQPLKILEERITLYAMLGFDLAPHLNIYEAKLRSTQLAALEQGQITLYKEINFKLEMLDKYTNKAQQ